MARIVFLYSDAVHINFNSSYWRCYLPWKALKERHPEHQVYLAHINTLPSYSNCDVFFLERNLFDPYLSLLLQLKAKGKKVYCTWDDNYQLMPKFLPGHAVWKEKLPEFLQGLGEIDGSLVPSQLLVDQFSKYGNIHLVENFYPDEWHLDEPVQNPEFELGLSCSVSHMESIKHSHILDALKQENHSLLLNAGQSHELMNLMSGLYNDYQSWTKQSDYPAVVDRFKIGLAPLWGEYDNYRSNLKVLLYAVRGRPFVASNALPYKGLERGGSLVENTAEGWLRGIKDVQDNYAIKSHFCLSWSYLYRISANLDKYEELIG